MNINDAPYLNPLWESPEMLEDATLESIHTLWPEQETPAQESQSGFNNVLGSVIFGCFQTNFLPGLREAALNSIAGLPGVLAIEGASQFVAERWIPGMLSQERRMSYIIPLSILATHSTAPALGIICGMTIYHLTQRNGIRVMMTAMLANNAIQVAINDDDSLINAIATNYYPNASIAIAPAMEDIETLALSAINQVGQAVSHLQY